MRVKEPICERCFFDIYPKRDVACICVNTAPRQCGGCDKTDLLVVDYILHGESIAPEKVPMQSGLSWRKIKW